jgi:uncharacterized membrane protein
MGAGMRRFVRRKAAWDYLRGALWVLPTTSVLLCLLAGVGLSALEIGPDSALGPLVFQGTAGDARDLLIVVSATMITVTGLVFSLSVVALQIASSQFSPRLLRGFLRDRGNQLVLSVFVGTFAYATAGLHTVGARDAGRTEFVPRLAVSGALFLALASLAMLVYFIHHIAHSIQIDTIMGRVERETLAVVEATYPERAGAGAEDEQAPDPPAAALVVPALRTGYVQAVDHDELLRVAVDAGVTVRLVPMVGDYVIKGTALAWAWPRSAGSPAPGPLAVPLNAAVAVGYQRTMLQDAAFGIRQLVDIANKALSPAVNDPYTAVQAVQHVSVVALSLAERRLGARLGRDQTGTVRTAVPAPDLADFLKLATAQIRRFGAGEPAVARALLRLLVEVGARVDGEARREAVARHVRLVMADSERETAQPADFDAVLADAEAALRAVGAAAYRPGPPDGRAAAADRLQPVEDAAPGPAAT